MVTFSQKTTIVFVLTLTLPLFIATYKTCSIEYPPNPIKKNPENRAESNQIQLTNINNWITLLNNNTHCDMIVFPEYGLYPLVTLQRDVYELYGQKIIIGEVPDKYAEDQKIIYTIAQLSIEYDMVFFVNMVDKEDGYLYNTQVAVENGVVLAKYHKYHLFGSEEKYFDRGDGKGVAFTNLKGFTFGLIVCYDIMFTQPTLSLLEMNVSNVIMSSMWVNYPPVLNALQVMQSYSYVNNVILVASNNGFSNHSSGSGIFQGGDVRDSFYNRYQSPQIGVLEYDFSESELKGKTSSIPPSDNDIKRKETKKLMKYQIVDTSEVQNTKSLFELPGYKCEVVFNSSSPEEKQYFALYASTGYSLGNKMGSICGIIFCGRNQKDCVPYLNFDKKTVLSTQTQFHSIKVTSTSDEELNPIYPLIATNDMEVLQDLSTLKFYTSSESSAQKTKMEMIFQDPTSVISFMSASLKEQ